MKPLWRTTIILTAIAGATIIISLIFQKTNQPSIALTEEWIAASNHLLCPVLGSSGSERSQHISDMLQFTTGNTFKVGTSYYGVSDLEALAQDTHKFESRYLERLIGAYPQQRQIYQPRSPINHTDRLTCPIIFF
ncbi:MAG: hypothetical protein V7K89_21255 [Nostoc sp.]|uniref:alpha/beta hydrolase family protein n=1 Tax=Nostoc sp. TaxID=1180 RepID=UPI002FF750B3